MKKVKHLSVTLEESEYLKLQENAQKDYRTVSGLVRYLIKQHICEVEKGIVKLGKAE